MRQGKKDMLRWCCAMARCPLLVASTDTKSVVIKQAWPMMHRSCFEQRGSLLFFVLGGRMVPKENFGIRERSRTDHED